MIPFCPHCSSSWNEGKLQQLLFVQTEGEVTATCFPCCDETTSDLEEYGFEGTTGQTVEEVVSQVTGLKVPKVWEETYSGSTLQWRLVQRR